MYVSIPLGASRSLQLILWGWEDREHWGIGYGRWPKTGSAVDEWRGDSVNWKKFGFHGFVFGIFEARYWPQVVPRETAS